MNRVDDRLRTAAPPEAPVQIRCATSGAFDGWMSVIRGTLAVTTYQAGKVALIGWDGQRVTLLMRHFDKPLGLGVQGSQMALATRNDLLLFSNASALAYDYLEDQPGRYDALYLPRASYHTGDLNIHDVVFDRAGLVAVNTRYSCLMRPSALYSFEPIWRPPFVTDLVPEDRCHLNGIGLVDGEIRYATALGQTDAAGGWRDNKATGGVLLEVPSGEVIAGGLSMPHSPRWHDGRLWFLNSGTGELMVLDAGSSRPTTVCSLPGYLRGLCVIGRYAAVGLSRIREKHIFGGLPIQERVKELQCGVAVVDLTSGHHVGTFQFTAGCDELYDIQFLPGIFQPMLLSLEKPACRQAFTDPLSSFWIRPGSEIHDDPHPDSPAAPSGLAAATGSAAPSMPAPRHGTNE